MRLREWVITLPSDFFVWVDGRWESNIDKLCEYAIDYVRDDVADDYCLPATWFSWICGEPDIMGEIPIAASRLSNGESFPYPQNGTCYMGDSIEDIELDGVIEEWYPKGIDYYVGEFNIDDDHTRYYVWLCPDGKFRAQLTHMLQLNSYLERFQ